jgi:hypothetical protein
MTNWFSDEMKKKYLRSYERNCQGSLYCPWFDGLILVITLICLILGKGNEHIAWILHGYLCWRLAFSYEGNKNTMSMCQRADDEVYELKNQIAQLVEENAILKRKLDI